MYKLALIIPLILIGLSCRKDQNQPTLTSEFIVIGHAYGHPLVWNSRLYRRLPPILSNYRQYINPNKFIFTGDVVAKSTPENWNTTVHQLDSMDIDFWIAPGNHDIGSDYMQNYVQSDLYFYQTIADNLFIILNTNFSGWTIDSAQIAMVKEALASLNTIDNVFVFTHQVWWANSNQATIAIDSIRTNSKSKINGSTTFWTDALPLFDHVAQPIYFFSGDVGAFAQVPAYSEHHHQNMHFYASGVGGALDDNVLHVQTFSTGAVRVNKINF